MFPPAPTLAGPYTEASAQTESMDRKVGQTEAAPLPLRRPLASASPWQARAGLLLLPETRAAVRTVLLEGRKNANIHASWEVIWGIPVAARQPQNKAALELFGNCRQCWVYGMVDMISAARFLGLATACATLLIAGASGEPASAQGDACKADVVTAAGRAKFRPFSKTKELEGRGSAMDDAVANWQRDVGARFGEQWKTWSKAKGTTFNCAPTKTGKIIGTSFIGCTISGRPCSHAAAATAAPRGGPVVDGGGGGGGPRDKGRRVRGGERLNEASRGYDREMAHQQHLAAEREKAESQAYEREMANQRRLEEQRRRAER